MTILEIEATTEVLKNSLFKPLVLYSIFLPAHDLTDSNFWVSDPTEFEGKFRYEIHFENEVAEEVLLVFREKVQQILYQAFKLASVEDVKVTCLGGKNNKES